MSDGGNSASNGPQSAGPIDDDGNLEEMQNLPLSQDQVNYQAVERKVVEGSNEGGSSQEHGRAQHHLVPSLNSLKKGRARKR